MEFPKKYKVLINNSFSENTFSLVPIRFEDKLKIMKWRNEQIYHLRQAKPLTEEDQNFYFENVVAKLFTQKQPKQILFSFLEYGECIGYGGLVHINWIDKNAEISFIMQTSLEEERFDEIWGEYLLLLEEMAFKEIKLHKIFVYAFDIRPYLYRVLEKNNYLKDAELKEHCFYNNEYINVIIHSKLNKI
jgi:RimJ/RimL family protein N-acetyltransferase